MSRQGFIVNAPPKADIKPEPWKPSPFAIYLQSSTSLDNSIERETSVVLPQVKAVNRNQVDKFIFKQKIYGLAEEPIRNRKAQINIESATKRDPFVLRLKKRL